jgi:hypothetical protein
MGYYAFGENAAVGGDAVLDTVQAATGALGRFGGGVVLGFPS